MKKIIAKITQFFHRAGAILAGLPVAQPQLRPIPVRADHVIRRR